MPPPPGATPTTVLVAGGTGFIGGIIARSLAQRGHTVIVPSRSAERLQSLARDTAGMPGTVIELAVTGNGPHRQAAAELTERGRRIGAVVAALGGWSKGDPLLQITEAEWDDALRDHLTSHLQAMQAYVPLLDGDADPVYITLNGAAATQAMAGSGAVSVTGAAQRMLTAVMRAEPIGAHVRFHELSLLAAVAGDDRNVDPDGEIAPEQIGAAVTALLDDPHSAAFVAVHPDGR